MSDKRFKKPFLALVACLFFTIMSIVVKHCDALLQKHHDRISPLILSVFAIAVFGFISPTLLYAAEVTSSADSFSPVPREFRPEKPRILFNTSSQPGMLASSTMPRRDDDQDRPRLPSSTERVIKYKTVRIQKLKEALATIEQQARDLRTQLENLQVAETTSTEAINLGQFNQKINALMLVFKKVNFNLELGRLKTELKMELNKRESQMKRELLKKQEEDKRELQKKQLEANRELYKKQLELNRETYKNEQELLKEQRRNNLPGAVSSSPAQTPAPSTTSNSPQ